MHLNQFQIILTVAEEKSMSQAAKKLHLSQPAISSQIKSMEQYFNAPLFERTPQGIEPTKAGEIVLQYARELLNTFSDLESAVSQHLQHDTYQMIIGASTTVGSYPLPCSVFVFKERHPRCDIRLELGNTATILAKVKNAEVDVAIVEGPVQDPQLVTKACLADELCVVAPNSGAWATKAELTLEELKSAPFILREEGSGIRTTFGRYLERRGIKLKDLKVVTEMTSIESIKSSVEKGHGLSVLPRLALRKELYTKTVKVLPIKDLAMNITFELVYRQTQILTPLTKEFISLVTNQEEHSFC